MGYAPTPDVHDTDNNPFAPISLGVVPTTSGDPFGVPAPAALVGGSPEPQEQTTPAPTLVSNSDNAADLETFFTRLFSNEVPEHVRRKSKDDVYTTLDTYGPGYFLEEVARGTIPVEIAFRYELPVLYFMRWLQDRADAEDYNYAMTLCADSLAAKSRAVLELAPDNAAEGQMIREYAKRALDLAERIAPDGWSSSKKPRSDGPATQALQIAIVMPPEAAAAGITIPGMELLAARPVLPASGDPPGGAL